ncbi:glycosyltransferase family 4 protein [Candidatus Pelagibacter sp.]|nr:glycosyltransferase family 4 protein [Candidatus Pelagibacter sp.]
MIKSRTAFVTFFPIKPDTMGSSTVVNSRFINWPGEKKIFQISHVKKINNKLIKTVYIQKETPLNKILRLPEIIFKIRKYFYKSKKNFLIIEGASWIFYSFCIIFFFKFFSSKIKIIYISHSIESEIRKKFSNKLIFLLTKILENLVFKISDISTSVSEKERKKIKLLYKKKTILLPNGITLDAIKRKKINIDYIIYTGSYSYKPNKYAIDYLNSYIMPELIKKIPNLKLMLTGGGFKKEYPWIINKGIVKKNYLHQLVFNSKCLCVPLKFGSGTRIKIIEALCLGALVVSTIKGIEGINIKSTNPPFIINNKKKFVKIVLDIIKNNKKYKKKSINSKNYFLKQYSMRNIINKFINENNI